MTRPVRTLLAGLIAVAVAVAAPALAGARGPSTVEPFCQPVEAGVNCGPGNSRQTEGGGGAAKVPHNDGLNKQSPATRSWPKISGILWMVVEESHTPRSHDGGPSNDELLGHHGSDHLTGGAGHDVLWGDWDPNGNTGGQRDILDGGPGNDWLYPSHGRSVVRGGAGTDYVWAFYGKGTIDCGPGIDTARIRTTGAFKTKNCEKIRHFCSNGENRQGQCLSPTGKPVAASRRSG